MFNLSGFFCQAELAEEEVFKILRNAGAKGVTRREIEEALKETPNVGSYVLLAMEKRGEIERVREKDQKEETFRRFVSRYRLACEENK